MMLLLLVLSSSEVARAEAQVWLAAFDEARATGATELQAHRYACGELGVFDRGSGMVAGTHAARPPPAPAAVPNRAIFAASARCARARAGGCPPARRHAARASPNDASCGAC